MRAVAETLTGDQALNLPDDSGLGHGTNYTSTVIRRMLTTVSLDLLAEGGPTPAASHAHIIPGVPEKLLYCHFLNGNILLLWETLCHTSILRLV